VKNIHGRLAIAILILLAAAGWVMVKEPTRLGLDIKGGMRVVLRAKKEELKGAPFTKQSLETVAGIIRNRVDSLGVAEPVIYTIPENDQIVVELPGLKNKEEARAQIQTTAQLEFRYVPEITSGEWTQRPEVVNGKETGFEELIGRDGKPVSPQELEAKVFSRPAELNGKDLEANSRAELTPQGSIIHFEFKGDAKRTCEEFTRSHLNKPMAIFLDKKLISAPKINDVIPGIGIIQGRFTTESAKRLAGQLNAGALPVPLEWQYDYSVEATLGDQSVKQTTTAGIVGLVAVLLFMLVYYKVPGLLADVALILYTVFSIAMFKLIPITLTVPGIAGFILSIGMAVDANILIFERMKEERLAGKPIRAAIEAGFKRAFTAILDSNVCTLITCGILYQLGTGPVRGFALTLAVGVIVSMFTAITCSRTLLLLFAGTSMGQNDSAYALGKGLHPRLDVTKRMKFWFTVSGLIILPGIVCFFMGGLKKGIEFTGGTEIGAKFNTPVSKSRIEEILKANGLKESRILLAEGNRAYITTATMPQQVKDKLTADLQRAGATIETSSTVSGAISAELTYKAFLAVLLASITIVLYLALRFSIPSFVEGLKFGICAVAALLHDVLVVIGAFAVLGLLLNWQIDSLFVTAMLTVIGFSVHDTIIIFDRIRENLHHRKRDEDFAHISDRSIEQTFARSINTSGTVVITLLALLALGGPVTRLFVTALLIGIVSGTYSSIFNATPLLVLWKMRRGELALAPAAAGAPVKTAARPAPAPKTRTAAPRPAAEPTTPRAADPQLGEAESGTDADEKAAKSRKRKRRM
jgi:SecD/SecF fusion protein